MDRIFPGDTMVNFFSYVEALSRGRESAFRSICRIVSWLDDLADKVLGLATSDYHHGYGDLYRGINSGQKTCAVFYCRMCRIGHDLPGLLAVIVESLAERLPRLQLRPVPSISDSRSDRFDIVEKAVEVPFPRFHDEMERFRE